MAHTYTDVVRLWGIYRNMLSRCSDENNKSFPRYGGRGIVVCPEWWNFDVFCQWALGHGYAADLQIDRIDNDGPYAPGNCRWVDRRTNGQNKRNNRRLTAFGETKTLSEWARDPRCSVSAHVLSSRTRDGWDAVRTITTSSTRTAKTCINGHSRKKFTVTRPNGARYCKRCQADRSSARYHRLMAEQRGD